MKKTQTRIMQESLELPFKNSKELLEFYLDRIHKITFLRGQDARMSCRGIERCINDILRLKEQGAGLRDYRTLNQFKEIWKLLVKEALRDLGMTMQKPLQDLHVCFEKMVDFEEMLFGAERFYRDHVVHSLWVYLLGEYVRSKDKGHVQISWPSWQVLACPGDCGTVQFRTLQARLKSKLKKKIDAAWCVIALCHDMGYPLEKVCVFDREINKFLAHLSVESNFFRTPTAGPFWLSIPAIQQEVISEVLSFASRQLHVGANGKTHSVVYNPVYFDLCKDFPSGRHGLASAYILYRLIVAPWIKNWKARKLESIQGTSSVEFKSQDLASRFQVWASILEAIISHTCSSKKVEALDDVGSALVLHTSEDN
jgi:hypothetical protein